MTPNEAIALAIQRLDWKGSRMDAEAAAILSKLGPFVEAAMEHGQYRNRGHAGMHNHATCNCCCHTEENFIDAYRALVASTKEPSDGG